MNSPNIYMAPLVVAALRELDGGQAFLPPVTPPVVDGGL